MSDSEDVPDIDSACEDAWLKWVAETSPGGPSAESFFAGWNAAVPVLSRHQRASHMTKCQSDCNGICTWEKCPQLRDGEPAKSGRRCPLDKPSPILSRYQRATLRILALFDGDPLRPDFPAQFLVERLEALLDQNYLATRAEVDEAKARHSDFVDNFARTKLVELRRQTERTAAAEDGLRRAHQALADRAVASGAAWRTAPDRASCPVCGEPLGQVPPGLRPQLGDWSCDTCPEERGTAGACQADLMHRGSAFFWDRDVRRDSGTADARTVTALVTRHAYDELDARATLLRRERNAAAESARNGFWYWSDTDANDLQSLTDDALVTMRAEQLRKLLADGESSPGLPDVPELEEGTG